MTSFNGPDRQIAGRAAVMAAALAATIALGGAASAATLWEFEFTGDSNFGTGPKVDWTATETGTYRVTAVGARGATGASAFLGGRGAQIAGTFTFTAGELFRIAVGGMGGADATHGGGGGGTFFVKAGTVPADETPLLVAGGGGGLGEYALQHGTDASITTFAYTGSTGYVTTFTPQLKTTGEGMGGIKGLGNWFFGAGGGGFFGDGADDEIPGTNRYGEGGKSWAHAGRELSGGLGLDEACGYAPGGFGGGGSGNGCNFFYFGGGGGGGGYSGGDGGIIAGGGGSFNAGSDPFALRGAGTGNGWLRIELLSSLQPPETPSPVPLPAAGWLLLGGLGVLAGLARRRRAA